MEPRDDSDEGLMRQVALGTRRRRKRPAAAVCQPAFDLHPQDGGPPAACGRPFPGGLSGGLGLASPLLLPSALSSLVVRHCDEQVPRRPPAGERCAGVAGRLPHGLPTRIRSGSRPGGGLVGNGHRGRGSRRPIAHGTASGRDHASLERYVLRRDRRDNRPQRSDRPFAHVPRACLASQASRTSDEMNCSCKLSGRSSHVGSQRSCP